MRKPFQNYQIKCIACEKLFTAKKSHAKTCSSTCRSILSREKNKDYKIPVSIYEDFSVIVQPKSNSLELNNYSNSLKSNETEITESVFEYYIFTNSYGVGFSFFRFEKSLHSVSPDSCTLKEFENHLSKGNIFYKISKEDKEKVEALNILLKHRDLITKNIRECREGVNRYKGKYFRKTLTISIPEFQYHY